MEPWEQARVDQAEADEREFGKWLMRFVWALLILMFIGGVVLDIASVKAGR